MSNLKNISKKNNKSIKDSNRCNNYKKKIQIQI